ncbi:hypothetical protein [Flagellimonas meridianipacifica]|uniref:Uncharacterized protein n=1 Tax=Flagellimonas meridianipacifica TaxID=1080225 RepID=A0A2T0M8T0_9FLAO|nr:hypothetical protein [Allomuricauda pacifica]PRX53911.1 hypothetical protein CLV81_2304 [Allomuricauda pacifica]
MKNTKKNGLLLVLGGLLLIGTSCQERSKPSEEPEQEEKETVKPPSDIISIEQSKSLYDNYTRNRIAPIMAFEKEMNDDEEFEAARFVDFDYDTMKQYIAYVEQEAKKAKVDVSTFRLYFANYPNSEKFRDGKKVVHPRQNSIFILPTMMKNGQNMGFYIGADGQAQLIRNTVKRNEQGYGGIQDKSQRSQASFVPSLSAPLSLQEELSLIMNHGSSGPPPGGDF